MATRISLIRHGETDWNLSGQMQGHAAVPLNSLGRQQAVLLADYLYPYAAEITTIYSSDSARTRETAEIIASRLSKTVILDPRLREIDLGEWQGMTMQQVETWDGERLKLVRADSFNTQRPGGESFSQVADRATAALAAYIEAHRDEHILAVSHGGTIRSVLQRLGISEGTSGTVGNTSMTVLLHGPDGSRESVWKLDVFNLMDHLGPIRISGQEG